MPFKKCQISLCICPLAGVDEVQSLDFATGIDLAKWYFEASPEVFYRKALRVGDIFRILVQVYDIKSMSMNDNELSCIMMNVSSEDWHANAPRTTHGK